MFTKKDIAVVIFKLCKERYGVYRTMSKDTSFVELRFDKYDVLYMAMACEEYFKVHMSEEDIATLKDLRSLINLVTAKLRQLGTLTNEHPKAEKEETIEEAEAAEALKDAESNDGVPVGKTEGDFEREEMEENEKLPDPPAEIVIDAPQVSVGDVISQPMGEIVIELPPDLAKVTADDTVVASVDTVNESDN